MIFKEKYDIIVCCFRAYKALSEQLYTPKSITLRSKLETKEHMKVIKTLKLLLILIASSVCQTQVHDLLVGAWMAIP